MKKISNGLDENFFVERKGKIFKKLEVKNNRLYSNVKLEIYTDDNDSNKKEIIIYNSDWANLTNIFIEKISLFEVISVEVYTTVDEIIEIITNSDLKPPHFYFENLIDEMSSLKRKKSFDEELAHLLSEDELKKLCAILLLIADPQFKKHFAEG